MHKTFQSKSDVVPHEENSIIMKATKNNPSSLENLRVRKVNFKKKIPISMKKKLRNSTPACSK